MWSIHNTLPEDEDSKMHMEKDKQQRKWKRPYQHKYPKMEN